MPKPPKVAHRVRHDTGTWILKALESAGDGVSLPVKELRARIDKLGGGPIPESLVYRALKTLVKRGKVRARGRGRRHTFALAQAKVAPPVAPLPAAPRSVPRTPAPTPAAPKASAMPTSAAPLLHKLAPGEVSILHVSETHVEAATNVHGKLVLERHRRPSGEPKEQAGEGASS